LPDWFNLRCPALSGAVGATRCGLDYFGADTVVFASDFPFDAEGGSYLVRETIRALDALGLSTAVRRQIDVGNISKIIRRQ
jgi:predicted TIM-barrel fold metal-dependent hydrolase